MLEMARCSGVWAVLSWEDRQEDDPGDEKPTGNADERQRHVQISVRCCGDWWLPQAIHPRAGQAGEAGGARNMPSGGQSHELHFGIAIRAACSNSGWPVSHGGNEKR